MTIEIIKESGEVLQAECSLENYVNIDEGFDFDDVIVYQKPDDFSEDYVQRYAVNHYAYELLEELSQFRYEYRDSYFSL